MVGVPSGVIKGPLLDIQNPKKRFSGSLCLGCLAMEMNKLEFWFSGFGLEVVQGFRVRV